MTRLTKTTIACLFLLAGEHTETNTLFLSVICNTNMKRQVLMIQPVYRRCEAEQRVQLASGCREPAVLEWLHSHASKQSRALHLPQRVSPSREAVQPSLYVCLVDNASACKSACPPVLTSFIILLTPCLLVQSSCAIRVCCHSKGGSASLCIRDTMHACDLSHSLSPGGTR